MDSHRLIGIRFARVWGMDFHMNSRGASKRGLIEFVLQRLTAIVLGIYVIHLILVFVLNPDMDYQAWRTYFTSGYSMILASLAVLSVALHAWIGMWTVGTDYIRSVGPATPIRYAYQTVVGIALLVYVVWTLLLIWGHL